MREPREAVADIGPRPGAGGAELLAAKLPLANWRAFATHA